MAFTRNIPVDSMALGGGHGLPVVAILPKQHRNDSTNVMEQSHTAEGVPQYTIQTLITPQGAAKAELLDVTIAAQQQPSIPLMSPVRFENLACSLWTISGRSGLSFAADSVQPVSSGAHIGGEK